MDVARPARRALAACLLAALGAVALPSWSAAHAADNGSWAVFPAGTGIEVDRPFFAYEVRPGQRLVDSVSLVNLTDDPLTLGLTAADAYNTPTGAFALRHSEDEQTDLGAWVQLGVDRWTLAPRTRVDVKFELVVPLDAEPGDHVGGIVATNLTSPRASQDGFGVDVLRAVGTRIYGRVQGPTRAAVRIEPADGSHRGAYFPRLDDGRAVTRFVVTNAGNVRLNPSARIEVRGMLDRHVATFDLGPVGEILPGNSLEIEHEWRGVPSIGPVTERLVIEGDGIEVSRSARFFVVPWWLFGAALVVATLALGARWWVRARSRDAGDATDERRATRDVADGARA